MMGILGSTAVCTSVSFCFLPAYSEATQPAPMLTKLNLIELEGLMA